MRRLPVIAVDETGRRHGPFALSIVAELERMGIMWCTPDGEYHIRAEHRDIVALNPHIAVCDICSCSPVAWDADVAAFESIDPAAGPFAHFRSEDGFYLCEPCGQFVLAYDRQGLLRRQLREFMRRWSMDLLLEERADLKCRLEQEAVVMHGKFWANYYGMKRIEK